MATGLSIHCLILKIMLMHGTRYLDLATSNRTPTIIQYYREAGAPLIQHVCVILAFDSSLAVMVYTMSSNLNTPVSANPRQSFDS